MYEHKPTKKSRGRPSLYGLSSAQPFLSEAEKRIWADDSWCRKVYVAPPAPFGTRYNGRNRVSGAAGAPSVVPINGLDYILYPEDTPRVGTKDIRDYARLQYKIKVSGYASDRLKLVSYPVPVAKFAKRMKRSELAAIVRGPTNLGSRFEVRRTYLIGGRRRSLPQFTRWTTNAKDYVRDGAGAIEKYCKGVCFFATLTIPGGTEECYRVLSAASGYAVDRLTRWLRYRVVDGLYVLVWELQKRGAPHLHLMFRLQGDEHIKAVYRDLRLEWAKILHDISNDAGVNLLMSDAGIDCRHDYSKVNCNYKPVRYDFAAYISKYMSKAQSKADGSFSFRPGRWWGLSEGLRALVRQRRFEQVIDIAGPEEFALFVDTLCAHSFDLFDKLICYPAKEVVRPDVYSFECGAARGRETAIAVAAWICFGDITEIEVLESERKKFNFKAKNRCQIGRAEGD
jgi:hypothetical protein